MPASRATGAITAGRRRRAGSGDGVDKRHYTRVRWQSRVLMDGSALVVISQQRYGRYPLLMKACTTWMLRPNEAVPLHFQTYRRCVCRFPTTEQCPHRDTGHWLRALRAR